MYVCMQVCIKLIMNIDVMVLLGDERPVATARKSPNGRNFNFYIF
jgi:hypothetical protein